jgi:hypothetical protein
MLFSKCKKMNIIIMLWSYCYKENNDGVVVIFCCEKYDNDIILMPSLSSYVDLHVRENDDKQHFCSSSLCYGLVAKKMTVLSSSFYFFILLWRQQQCHCYCVIIVLLCCFGGMRKWQCYSSSFYYGNNVHQYFVYHDEK